MLMNILSCRYLANVCISDYFVFSVYNRSITFHYNFSWLCYSIESSSVIIIIDGILFSFAHMRFSMIFLIVFVFLVLKLISFVEHWKKKSKIIQPKTKKKKNDRNREDKQYRSREKTHTPWIHTLTCKTVSPVRFKKTKSRKTTHSMEEEKKRADFRVELLMLLMPPMPLLLYINLYDCNCDRSMSVLKTTCQHGPKHTMAICICFLFLFYSAHFTLHLFSSIQFT